jgi:hypothetical protein
MTPPQAVFVGAEKLNHSHCEIGYRALTGRKAVAPFVKAHKQVLGKARVLTLPQLLEDSK